MSSLLSGQRSCDQAEECTVRATLARADERVDRRWSNAQAGMRDPRPVTRGFLQDDSRANFGVGDSCHLVGLERNIAAV